MSRLQVGGLALCLSNGLVCTLIEFIGDGFNGVGVARYDVWKIKFSVPVIGSDLGLLSELVYEESRYLLPLGDQQTQDELAKEKEFENV